MRLTNCGTCGGTTQIGAPWSPDTCPDCIGRPVVAQVATNDNPWEVK